MRSILRACGALGVLALFAPSPAAGQQVGLPAPALREPRGLQIAPNGGWKVRAERVRDARRDAIRRGDVRFLNSQAPGMASAVTGTFNIPYVFLAYSDTTVTNGVTPVIGDTSQFREVFLSPSPAAPRPYSLKTYYEQVSNNRLTVAGNLYGWINTPKTYLQVGQGCNGVFIPPCTLTAVRAGFGQMLKAALDSLSGVNWGQYDNDGVDNVPNSGDDDGVVDFITFVHPTLGGECGGAGSSNRIWSHQWTLSSAIGGGPYVTTTPRSGGGFITINSYLIQGARGGTSACNGAAMMELGTLAHETGHAFGIPDLYDTGNDGGQGIGEWGLMGSGNYTVPRSPASFDAWSQLELGWVNADTLSTSRTVHLSPVQTSDTVLIVPITGTDEYLILENRARLGSDTAQMDPGRPASGFNGGLRKDPGLLIWHIDLSVIAAGRGPNSVNAGAIEGVRLVQADGGDDLHAGSDRGDNGDVFPGATLNRRLLYGSTPASTTNNGLQAGFVIDSIQMPSDVGPVHFRFRRSAPFRVTTSRLADFATVTVNGVTLTAYEELFGLGDSVFVSVADTQLINSGRTQLVFASWTDGQARVHTIISDGTPDTVVATLNARHRVNFVANGSGTVGTSGPATNTFVNQGTSVTLTASPTGGGVFTNWTGDTTSSNATLVLPMGRPFSVTANFTAAVAVSFDEATNDILGIANMSVSQRNYLDLTGNNNAVFDLGDYLHFLQANGLVVSPELLARILTGPAPSKEQ